MGRLPHGVEILTGPPSFIETTATPLLEPLPLPRYRAPTPTPGVFPFEVAMRHSLLFLLLAAATLVGAITLAPHDACAQEATHPLDWGPYERKLFAWPFQELDYWTEKDGMFVKQFTKVRETPEQIVERLKAMRRKNELLGGFVKISAPGGFNPGLNMWEATLVDRYLSYHVKIRADGGGAVIEMTGTPRPMANNYFHRTLYPYRLGQDRIPASYADIH